jgi:hypothetical protein
MGHPVCMGMPDPSIFTDPPLLGSIVRQLVLDSTTPLRWHNRCKSYNKNTGFTYSRVGFITAV